MRIDPIQLTNKNQLISDYRGNKPKIMQFFDHSPFHNYDQRINELRNRMFNREQLVETLHKVNEQWDAPDATYRNIRRLKDENSVVVIGGQQAGLMTGPMYTINKIISIIQFAKQQELRFKIPVIPVFWIAGEDHDYDEINHIFLQDDLEMKKYKMMQNVREKQPISNVAIDEKHVNEWLNQLFEQLNETNYTKSLYATVKNCLEKSKTYVDFFARLIYQLFTEEGIVLMDSAHPKIRQLESEYFVQLIEKQPDISSGVFSAFQRLKQLGYSVSLDIQSYDGHLFYHKNGERILLERNDSGEWIGKQNEMIFTTKEIIHVAKNNPELLSNNVITRPLMQELLFPTLAFVGGDGEISYWAVLKPAFHAMNIKMPPVLPRLSFTYIDKNTERKLEKLSISSTDAVNQGVAELKGNWLASQNNPPIHHMVNQIKQAIDNAHRPLRNVAKEIRSDLGELSNRNLDYLHHDISYLEDKIIKALEEKYERELTDFDRIDNKLNPNGVLQERVWNPLQFINEYGPYFINELSKESCSFEYNHYLVYI